MKINKTLIILTLSIMSNLSNASSSCVCIAHLELPNGKSKTFCTKPKESITNEAMCKSFCANLDSNSGAINGLWGSDADIRVACSMSGQSSLPIIQTVEKDKLKH